MQRPVEVSGAIFGCTDQTESECLSRKLFGLKGTSWSTVSQVVEGMPLWLYNFERKVRLHLCIQLVVLQHSRHAFNWYSAVRC